MTIFSSILKLFWYTFDILRGKGNQTQTGLVYVINNCQFKNPKNDLKGSQHDIQRFTSAFEKWGYEVKVKHNLTAEAIIKKLDKIRDKLKVDPKPFVAIFLSHGQESIVYGSDENPVYMRQIMEVFSKYNCEEMDEILKLFIVCACRGDKSDFGVRIKPEENNSDAEALDFDDNNDYNNFYVIYPSTFGYVSINNCLTGDRFGEQLCKVIENKADKYDLDLMIKLTQEELHTMNIPIKEIDSTTNKIKEYIVKLSVSAFKNNVSKKIYLTNGYEERYEVSVENKYVNNGRKICYIFDNYHFNPDLTHESEFGSHKDRSIYEKGFTSMGYDVSVIEKPTFEVLKCKLESIPSETEDKCSSFVCIFLTNGNERSIKCSNGWVSIQDIIEKISNRECPKLIGVPKLVIISPIFEFQKCNQRTEQILAVEPEILTDTTEDIRPTFGDTIICYSVISGDDINERSPIYGSKIFSKVLMEELREEHETKHIEEIMYRVTEQLVSSQVKVSQGISNNHIQWKIVNQSVCCEAKALTKCFYL